MKWKRFENLKTSDIDKLIMQLLSGEDEKALKIVFESYFNRLAGFSVKFVKNREIARDITQDAILRFWEKRNHLSDNTRVLSYLLTIVRNLSLNYLRDMQRNGVHLSLDESFSDEMLLNYKLLSDTVWEELLTSELEEIITKSAQLIPERSREVFFMSRMEHLSHTEIAKKLNISQKTVEGHISEALKIIRKQLPVYLIITIQTVQF